TKKSTAATYLRIVVILSPHFNPAFSAGQFVNFEFTHPITPLAVLTSSQSLTAFVSVWISLLPSCNTTNTGQSKPPPVRRFSVPDSNPVLTWHTCGVGKSLCALDSVGLGVADCSGSA